MGNANGLVPGSRSQQQAMNKVAASAVSSIPDDYLYMKNVLPQLKKDLKDRETKIDALEAECTELRRQLKKRDVQVMTLEREIHKFKVSFTLPLDSYQCNIRQVYRLSVTITVI